MVEVVAQIWGVCFFAFIAMVAIEEAVL